MSNIPVFVEVPDSKEAGLCARAVAELTKQNFPSVAQASSLEGLQDILKQFAERKLTPGVFIVNTFKAKPIIPQLDKLMGEAPAVFLRRGMYAGQSGLMEQLGIGRDGSQTNTQNTMATIGKMTPRLISIWQYGSKNADQAAQKIVKCVLRFAEDGDFKHFELANRVGNM
jgi:hypothetical protein